MASVIVRASAGFDISNQRRGVTPLVLLLKRSRIHLGQILDRHRAQQPRVNRGDTVGAVRADDGQVGHADVLGSGPPR